MADPVPTLPLESSASDADLVLAIASGSREALGALYERYAGIGMAVALRILKSEQEAEDILQDVFVEVWRRAGSYDMARASVRTWVLLLVRSRALDRCRSAGFRTSLPLDTALHLSATPCDTYDHARVGSMLQSLSEQHRAVIELGYFDGLSSSEIAIRLNIPVGTVKSRVATALAKLRQTVSDGSGTGAAT